MNATACSRADDLSQSSHEAQVDSKGVEPFVRALFNTKGRRIKGSKDLKGRSHLLPHITFDPLILRPFALRKLNSLWPVAVNRFFTCIGQLKHLALDYASDLFKITVACEQEDPLMSLPQMRNLAVADEDRRRVRIVRAELQPGHSSVQEQHFLRKVETDAQTYLLSLVDALPIAARPPSNPIPRLCFIDRD